MAGPLRKPRQRASVDAPVEEKRRLTLRLSAPMLGVAGVALAITVGWSFFMGFMVGRGQNPEQRVEQMTRLGQQAAPRTTPPPAPKAGPAPDAAAAQEEAAPPAADAPKAQAAAPSPKPDASPAAPPPDPARQAYPFASPSGSGLAAWGIKAPQGQAGQPANPPASKPVAKPAGEGPAVGAAPAQASPLYDFVFQVAAFKNQSDAEKLRAVLEGKGLRGRLQKSGKVQLVMVSLRGTEADAEKLREEMKRMKLGAPALASQKAVAGKDRKTGR